MSLLQLHKAGKQTLEPNCFSHYYQAQSLTVVHIFSGCALGMLLQSGLFCVAIPQLLSPRRQITVCGCAVLQAGLRNAVSHQCCNSAPTQTLAPLAGAKKMLRVTQRREYRHSWALSWEVIKSISHDFLTPHTLRVVVYHSVRLVCANVQPMGWVRQRL